MNYGVIVIAQLRYYALNCALIPWRDRLIHCVLQLALLCPDTTMGNRMSKYEERLMPLPLRLRPPAPPPLQPGSDATLASVPPTHVDTHSIVSPLLHLRFNFLSLNI